jgi:hypothetical protein
LSSIVGLTLTVEDDQITQVAPNPAALGSGLSDFEECRSNVSGDVPVLPPEEYADVDRRQHLKDSVRDNAYSATTVTCVDGLDGQLNVENVVLTIETEDFSTTRTY